MLINTKFLPIKGHYFFFLGGMSPIYPFLIVIARQMGVPVLVQGTISAIILVVIAIFKPALSSLADAFPKARKGIFIMDLVLMVSCLVSIYFLPPMHGDEKNGITGDILYLDNNSRLEYDLNHSNASVELPGNSDLFFLLANTKEGSCYPQELWDCQAKCQALSPIVVPHILALSLSEISSFFPSLSSKNESTNIYILENAKGISTQCPTELSFSCEGGLYEGEGCQSLWENFYFYLYLSLLTLGLYGFATGNSISDAICIDQIGKDGEYGNQRAWGTVGWGLMGPISGFLVDWYSGGRYGKNYMPAFLIMFVFGLIDILLSATTLKVPRMKKSENLWQSVRVVLQKRDFLFFLFFVVMAGSFDGVVASYIFVLQEDMAKDTDYHQHMKFIQGLTTGIQCLFEAPFMWVCGWLLSKMKSSTLLSLVFFLYMIRLFGLALVGSYGPVWATLVTEILNGPCYGLGYTAIVVHAGLVSPPGASTTVQSITNICYESFGYSLANLLGGIFFSIFAAPGIYYMFGTISVVTFFLHLASISCSPENQDAAVEAEAESALQPTTAEPLLESTEKKISVVL